MKQRLLFSLLALSSSALAQNYMCPSTYKYVQPGLTLGQILIACGQPTSTRTTEKEVSSRDHVLELVYNRHHPTPSTLLVKIQNNKIIELNVDGSKVASTNFCGRIVHIGSAPGFAHSTCGQPTLVNQVRAPSRKVKITEVTYQPQQYMPAITFVFEDNKLIGTK